jgi:hypothetical protein
MAKDHGMGDQLYIDGVDLGGDINSLSNIGGGNTPIEVTDITQRAMARLGGKRFGGFAMTCYFDPAADASHAKFSALPTADVIASYGHGTTAGNPIANLVAKQINYDPNRGDDGSLLIGVELQSNAYGLEWCTQLTAGKLTQSSAANVASVDLGSASPGAFGLQMYVHLFAFTGTSVTIKLQESSDNAAGDAFADVVGATTGALTTAPQALRIATGAIAVERYLRVVTTGTFSNAQFLVSAVRNPVAVVF